VALLVLTPGVRLDATGIAAGLAGAVSMACGTVLTRKWRPPVPLLTFTAWQLTAGGLLLLPVALWAARLSGAHTGPSDRAGLAGPGGRGADLCAVVSRYCPAGAGHGGTAGFLSPLTAILLGWAFLDQTLTAVQMAGVALVLGGIWLGQRGAAR
jgi:probable blue pigment (indigoidine) exporter